MLSRRRFGQIVAGSILAEATAATKLLSQRGSQTTGLNLQRTYRAEAQVLLLGMSLLRRESVGGGSVQWRETDTGADRLLEFIGFSTPEQAAGLNRFGFIREQSRVGEDGGAEFHYFGLMNSSPEESAQEARKAIHSIAKEQTYTVIDGKIADGETHTAVAQFTAPAPVSGEHRAQLMERARRALATDGKTADSHLTREHSRSFLQTLADLLLRPDGESARYSYAGRPYQMRLTRSIDSKATTDFRQRSMVGRATNVIRVCGKVRRVEGGKETEFRLWIPAGAERPLPLRIEYQPRSYLRLTFEAQA
jgi:hypothetical protein